ncbi:MAG: cytochrome P450 [Pseudomonadales bacterium]
MSEPMTKNDKVVINPLDLPYQDPLTTSLEELDVARPQLFEKDEHWAYFERLRKDAPVHYCKDSAFGPYWSVSSFKHIKEVDQRHDIFSSEPAITIDEQDEDFKLPMFIAMDQPKHDVQRKVVQPAVAPRNLQKLEGIIRERTGKVLDEVPHNEEFDWVDTVSIELTTMMLATIFDFPYEDRRKLTHWSDVATGAVYTDFTQESQDKTQADLIECLGAFTEIWHDRVKNPGDFDMITMLAHNETTKDMVNDPMEYLGNLMLLIVGGNDTTRNSMTGSVYALNKFMDQYDKLRADQSLIPNMVSEVIRWQTPLAHMRRKAKADVELGGKTIKAGDKVIMWYVSGNRDETVFENPHNLIIDRHNARQHVSFGFGIHRCMGNRLAEMQLKILWEEIDKRFEMIEVLEEPGRSQSVFVKGYNELKVRVLRK